MTIIKIVIKLLELILSFTWLVTYFIPEDKLNLLYIVSIINKLKLIGTIVTNTIKETKGI